MPLHERQAHIRPTRRTPLNATFKYPVMRVRLTHDQLDASPSRATFECLAMHTHTTNSTHLLSRGNLKCPSCAPGMHMDNSSYPPHCEFSMHVRYTNGQSDASPLHAQPMKAPSCTADTHTANSASPPKRVFFKCPVMHTRPNWH